MPDLEETGGPGAPSRVRGAPDTLLHCKYARRNGVGIVHASGEIDLHNIHRLAEILDGALGDNRTVIIDFAEVRYIDSTGLNMLMRLHERCTQHKTTLLMVTSRHVRWIFSVLSLQDVFRIFPSVDAALRAVSQPDGLARLSPRGQETDISTGRPV